MKINEKKIERTLQPHGLAGLLTGSIKQIGHLSSSLSTSELILSKLPNVLYFQSYTSFIMFSKTHKNLITIS